MHRQPLHSSWPRCVHLHGAKRVATTFLFFLSFFFLFAYSTHTHTHTHTHTRCCLIFIFSLSLFRSFLSFCSLAACMTPPLESLAYVHEIKEDSVATWKLINSPFRPRAQICDSTCFDGDLCSNKIGILRSRDVYAKVCAR